VLASPLLKQAFVGIVVEDLSTGRILYSKNEDRLFLPASNEKLLTTAAALHWLGPDYRYATKVCATGIIDSTGVLHGDLVIVGSGDPSFSRAFGRDPDSIFFSWADSLKSKSVKRIEGSVLADESLFDSERLGYGWDWHYLSSWYAGEVSALSYGAGSVEIEVAPGDSAGAEGSILLSPQTSYMKVKGSVVTALPGTSSSVSVSRMPFTNEITVSGAVPVGEEKTSWRVSVSQPEVFFVHRLTEILKADSIEVSGEPGVCDSTRKQGSSLLFTHYSPLLDSIVNVTNRWSENLCAEMLFKTVGAKASGKGTFETGARAVEEYLHTIGIDTSSCVVVDGSGLSRRNLVTPRDMVKLLDANIGRENTGVLPNSLPVSGSSGTLSERMKERPLAGRIHAKTGSLDQASALTGYAVSATGRPVAFSMLTNHFPENALLVKSLEDSVCTVLVNYRARSNAPR
jgi:D-alanyl-D-alanine carboxypeptidase/D-alanyl-D-alanine-endopeptidase (penicillin-binding protein 4)